MVGVNAFTEGADSPLLADGSKSILEVDASAEREQVERLQAFRRRRSEADAKAALTGLRDAVAGGGNVMPPSIRAAQAGVTTGEWTDALRELFGEYRAPTGVVVTERENTPETVAAVRQRARAVGDALGRPIKLLVGKPGLDGHSNGAEQIAVAARDAGLEVVYEGIRLTPEQIVESARDEGVHVIGLSILSGSHGVLVIDVLERLHDAGLAGIPLIVGGIIPEDDARKLREAGVKRVYTPRDYDRVRIMGELVEVVAEAHACS